MTAIAHQRHTFGETLAQASVLIAVLALGCALHVLRWMGLRIL